MTKPWFKTFLFVCCCLSLICAHSQQTLRFDRLGRNDGLSQSSVNCMLRDRDGFMWFGTQDGLNLYDGKKFRIFQNQPGDSSSLSNNYIVSICEDEKGYIWIGTMTGGLNRFDKNTEQFRVFLHSDSVNSISENTVWTVLSEGDGNIWAGTSYGVNRYNKATGVFKTFRPVAGDSTSLATDLTVSLFKDRRGKIWVGTVEGLCRFNEEYESFERFYNPSEIELKGANIIWSIAQSPGGEIITGTDNGVYKIDPEFRTCERLLGSKDDKQLVAWSVATENDRIWVGSDRGLFSLNTRDLSYALSIHDPLNPSSIGDNNVWCLLPDPGGFLWAGTNNGISKTRNYASGIGLFSADDWQPLRLSSSKIMAILEDSKGFLWIGTDGGGLNRISPDRKTVTVFNSSNSSLRNNNIWALAEDGSGNIYIGSYQGGLHKFDATTGRISSYPLNIDDPYSLSNRRVLALMVDNQGLVWIGTRGGGLSRLDPVSGRFRVFTKADNDPSGFPSVTVLSLAMDPQGRVWAGTHEGGLALFSPSDETFIVFRHINGDVNSLSENNVWDIEFDSHGRMWAGTQGGLNFAEHPGESMKFRYLTVNEGLKSNIVLGIKEDPDGNIWLSSFSGLAKLDITLFDKYCSLTSPDETYFLFNPLFTLFDTDHGLQGLEFNNGACFKSHDGTLYFGGNNGLNYFTDKDVKASEYQPPLVITGFKIFNREVVINPEKGLHPSDETIYFLQKKITFLDELSLSYKESVFSFEFSVLDYKNPQKNQYAYKMEGFDENWNYMGIHNTATYTNLDPGVYTFLVRGSNSDGVWNSDERRLKISITPPFWKTSWFITISIIIILLIFFLLIRSIFINQKRKVERDKALIELQLKTIKSQIDPHFAFNAINTIASYIFADKPDITYDYFTRFARMIRTILEDNEKISRTLGEELDFVRNYLELQKLRFKEKLEYLITIDEKVPLNSDVPKMIIQSYAENSIKHGLMNRISGGKLTISVTNCIDNLELIIEDNGIGREKAALLNPDSTHRGFGIMARTISLYSKLYHTRIIQDIEDLKDENGNAAGTRVILRIFPAREQSDKRKKILTGLFK